MNAPKVSILIAARNEENNIPDLLRSLSCLSYPKEKTQILIGNDGSTDKTAELTEDFIAALSELEKSMFKVLTIEKSIAGLRGKANVLAQLAHHATGEYFALTDADVEVPPDWLEKMLALIHTPGSNKKAGVATGLTLVKNDNWFEACQAIEWLFALKLMKTMTEYRLPSTGMGNNMMVTKDAYWAVGGYETIGFSIVEDYALYKAIIDKGFDFKQGFDASVMTVTKPPPNYFEQRKRWVAGGISTGSILIYPALLQGFALPILITVSFFVWQIPFIVVGFNLLVNVLLGYQIFVRLGQLRLFRYIPVYTAYMYVFWFLQLMGYFLPTRLVWKGRNY
ncbi:glycosyltransferase [Emticicia sp. BO119]|uniref:glycosyltransferase n=1 Tax=Emticicia sp. BO119 TaxID=2757768 RepID=UPI0015F0A728|nr:glycosyltransferase [Emticicia sp. BO119]MBA4848804.1 glycosyltransferase [Emticicia sp. BO119]